MMVAELVGLKAEKMVCQRVVVSVVQWELRILSAQELVWRMVSALAKQMDKALVQKLV